MHHPNFRYGGPNFELRQRASVASATPLNSLTCSGVSISAMASGTPVKLDGLRMLLTPLPQEEFNPTDDRKTRDARLGVACLDCHVNGHTTAQFHLTPDMRPQERRFRLDTTSLRGVFNQQIHGSKRSLRSVEDFTEFEQRTAYFNGDEVHASKKGMNILDRIQVSHMAQMQNMFDFPPAPKLNPATGRLDPG